MRPDHPEGSLRHRVVAACVLLAALVGGVFAAATYVLIESVEHELIDRRLSRAMTPLLAGQHGGSVALPPMDLSFVSGPQLPPGGELDAMHCVDCAPHAASQHSRRSTGKSRSRRRPREHPRLALSKKVEATFSRSDWSSR